MTAKPIELNRSEIERLLGTTMQDGEVERILLALDFKIEPTLWGWSVQPPANRLDIQSGAADLIEDLARVSGYDRLPERLLAMEMPPPTGNRSLELEELVRDRLVVAGLSECITYSLNGPEAEACILGTDANVLALKNPISPERSILRRTLLPGLLDASKRHLETTGSASIFEVGAVFLPSKNPLPDEPRHLAILLSGKRGEMAWDNTSREVFDFFDLKGLIEALLEDLHIENVAVRHAANVPHLHPARAAEVMVNGASIGAFGELHPKATASAVFVEHPVFVAEFDLEAILKAVPVRVGYRPFSTFPPAKRDIAVVVANEISSDKVLAELKAAGGELLVEAMLFDVYTGDKIPAGTKSLAYALTYQAADRTLGDKEILKAHEKVESRLKHVLKAQIRGKDIQ
jgi:phenylalanyl-tRNA synthetase beta chain